MITFLDRATNDLPHELRLLRYYSNCFNRSTTIKYELPKSSEVRWSVFDNLRREVSALVNERRLAGVYEVRFDGSNLVGVFTSTDCRREILYPRRNS
jgi:hypothetical protein